jgi:hypothetical protein
MSQVELDPGQVITDPATQATSLTPGSMAESIYNEMVKAVPLGANEDPIARQKFAVAVARGVISHLHHRQEAFVAWIPGTGRASEASPLSIYVVPDVP